MPAPTGVAIEGLLHAVEQQLFVVGFLDEIHRTGLEGAHHDGHVGMAADEDHRQVDAARQQFVLHVQPAHAGHPHVEQDAGMAAALAGIEEVPALGEGPCLEADRFQQPDRRFEHALVVVDHVDQRFVRHSHRYPPVAPAASGSRQFMSNPPSAGSSASRVPPKPSTMLRLIDRPRPSPSGLLVWNGVKMCSS